MRKNKAIGNARILKVDRKMRERQNAHFTLAQVDWDRAPLQTNVRTQR